ncbi:MAG: polyribonucleotide nucleotidyltransferase [Patescibacteria group bacterium]
MKVKNFETEIAGKKLSVEISDLADQANGAVLVRYGETTVFATAVMTKYKREDVDYFPLTVDYEERFYAAGMILGSRFIRREGKPSEEAILTARLIDRTIRPLFNMQIKNEVQVIVLALSIDNKNDPDIPAIIAASLALGISDIPWDGPVAAIRMGYINGNFIINPIYEERTQSSIDLVVCSKDSKINMVEACCHEIKEDLFMETAEKALTEIEKIQKFQEKIIKETGKEKVKIEIVKEPEGMNKIFEKEIAPKLEKTVYSGLKEGINELKSEWLKIAEEKFGKEKMFFAADFYERAINKMIHQEILNAPAGKERRPDGRKIDEIRPIFASVKVLPILHGSGLFFRGGTHILSVVTLGGPKDVQWIQGMEIQTQKHFMHHYNFPPFSTGETGRIGSPGRREIGHGMLAERALAPVIPDQEQFPYTIRIVSEAMASNGSTSMGSVCASTLALMDAGVPIKNPVAGIAIGLIMKDEKNYKILTDIQGPEDHHGDMDFKCAGTKEGVTAVQMDVKIDGITLEILDKVLKQGKKAREEILKKVLETIPESRKELSPHAPRIIKIKIDPEKIGLVIGPGGKMINSIIEKTNAEIDIEQDGTIFITGRNHEDVEGAKKIIEGLTHEFVVDEIVSGKIIKVFDFGAVAEIAPMQEGFIHISELSPFRVNRVTDVVNIGDIIKVKVISIDERGRINLSIKQLDWSRSNNNQKNERRGKYNKSKGNWER